MRWSHDAGSGATQAGPLLGLASLRSSIPVVGISSAERSDVIETRVDDLYGETTAWLRASIVISRDQVEVLDGYVGPCYGLPTEAMLEPTDLCARHEALLLDPVYTGKAMAGLINLVRTGRFQTDQTRPRGDERWLRRFRQAPIRRPLGR